MSLEFDYRPFMKTIEYFPDNIQSQIDAPEAVLIKHIDDTVDVKVIGIDFYGKLTPLLTLYSGNSINFARNIAAEYNSDIMRY